MKAIYYLAVKLPPICKCHYLFDYIAYQLNTRAAALADRPRTAPLHEIAILNLRHRVKLYANLALALRSFGLAYYGVTLASWAEALI
jgi:hypothetical protein